jgi:hypothetical protein
MRASDVDMSLRSGILGTGTYLPLTMYTGGSERLRIDTSGNVGIGTSSPATKLDVSGNLRFSASNPAIELNNGGPQVYSTVANTLQFATGGGIGTATERMRIDSNGNVGIGTSSPNAKLALKSPSASGDQSMFEIQAAGSASKLLKMVINQGADVYTFGTDIAGSLAFQTNATERMRIDSSGNLNLSTAGVYLRLKTGSVNFDISAQAGANDFLRINANGTQRFQFNDLGAAYNSTGTWGTISDARLKENIVDATSKLDKVNQLRVVNFNLKSDPDVKQIGFIAQEIEQVFPSIVQDCDEDGEGGYYKSVKTTVLIPILVKAIQEQTNIIADLKSRIEALENK